MSMKQILLLGALVLVGGITLLQIFVNWGGNIWGGSADGRERFRVGFLPVT
jgi:hypothetical protein